MPFDPAVLEKEYEPVRYSVHSSTKISARASAIITSLPTAPPADGKPVVVILHAGAKATSKLISIVEIAKRDLAAKGVKVFQYTALSSDLIEIDRVPKRKSAGPEKGVDEGDESDDDGDAFQTMGAGHNDGKKKREVPNLTVYLAMQSVKELSNEFGEQKP